MPVFVHVADQRDAASIRRSGLLLPKARLRELENAVFKHGVFAMPMVPDFQLTHQWVRELKRRGLRCAVGVMFRVPDDELVWAGLYNEPKVLVTASDCASWLHHDRVLGFEAVVRRAIPARAVFSIRPLPPVGWRYFPDAHERGSFCCCKFCQRGMFKGRRLWQGD